MDETDKIVDKYRSELEEEPNEGHFERFANRLDRSQKKRRGYHIAPFFKVAAILVIVLLSANLYFNIKRIKPESKADIVNHSDLREASVYYTSEINTGIRDLEKMASEGIGSKQEVVQIKHELSEMDSLFLNLQQEYKMNPNDERIINAMIEYYQTKLDIVNTIKTDLENVKQQKNRKQHENSEI